MLWGFVVYGVEGPSLGGVLGGGGSGGGELNDGGVRGGEFHVGGTVLECGDRNVGGGGRFDA